ncbi:MAG: twin-arginine translocation signal domain-containing protein [bacterium]|nr:twin-arginine translocation signal domain-containing protein [bacterium]
MNQNLNRREFVETGLAGVGALALGSALPQSANAATKQSVTDRVELGRTGIKASRLAIGTGSRGWARQSDQTRLGQKNFTRLMRQYFDSGLNFFDLADLYGSHPYFREALKELPREDIVILSKMWFSGGSGMPKTDAAKPDFERFRNELDVDAIDILLIHCVTDSNWPEHRKRMREEMGELKEKGLIRAVGCSCHDYGALKTAASDPWVDVIFSRINDKHKIMDEGATVQDVAETLKTARANGKAVIGMKIFGCGELVGEQQREESLRFVLGNQLVDAMTIGMVNEEQIKDNVSRIDRHLNA